MNLQILRTETKPRKQSRDVREIRKILKTSASPQDFFDFRWCQTPVKFKSCRKSTKSGELFIDAASLTKDLHDYCYFFYLFANTGQLISLNVAKLRAAIRDGKFKTSRQWNGKEWVAGVIFPFEVAETLFIDGAADILEDDLYCAWGVLEKHYTGVDEEEDDEDYW